MNTCMNVGMHFLLLETTFAPFGNLLFAFATDHHYGRTGTTNFMIFNMQACWVLCTQYAYCIDHAVLFTETSTVNKSNKDDKLFCLKPGLGVAIWYSPRLQASE